MLHVYPEYYDRFQCLASRCPDSCCTGWEVVVDDETAAFYEGLSTPLGNALQKAMTLDEDGNRIIRMENGHCPFWTENHLCGVELELGHEAPCATCRKFPRLTQDYQVFTEYGLTLACPEAARLILTQKAPWRLRRAGDPGDPAQADFDWETLLELASARERLLATAWRRDITSRQALALCLTLAQSFQRNMDGDGPQPMDINPPRLELCPGDLKPLLRFHRQLEILTPQWKELLDEALAFSLTPAHWAALEALPEEDCLRNLISYYLYRYWFQTVADYDCLLKLQLLAVNWAVVRYLCCVHLTRFGTLPMETRLRLFQLYAKEVEHDDINRTALEELLPATAEPLLSLI